ncbi:stemmadenine O-acetyltransferase-like [Diospyros lotus]|uniref:stemmadenine O-acetyltransferase-like n=1 Tax=Diospyros lotus TaxID=55363 RepID=UPI00224EABD0|nr:stemmadenine O-acetyltransferase-like [Diospyros lotus]
MTTKVTVISVENVKPSSPTPHHLRTHKLSFLDQLHPTIFSFVSLCYLKDDSSGQAKAAEALNKLKESLSKALTPFYPLAGRIQDDQLSIDCNDEGLYFSEARVNCNLSDFLREPDLDLLNHFYPCHPAKIQPYAGIHPVMIQVNVFDCSGIVLGFCLSHKILDGISTSAFLKGWAACAQGCFESVSPTFDATSLFPPSDKLPMGSITLLGRSMVRTGNCITRRFIFNAPAVAALKNKAAISSGVRHPSRIEVVSALIWKFAMSVAESIAGSRRPSILSHAVDLRRRMVPPLPEFSIGNLLWIPYTKCSAEEDTELHSLVLKLRETFTGIDADFVKKLQSGEGVEITCENVKEMAELYSKGPVDYYGFTSWSKFGIYDTDFGWGKPNWVGSHKISGPVFMNLIHIMETNEDDGIEAWITLDGTEMAMLLEDQEFLSFASVDPSPLL